MPLRLNPRVSSYLFCFVLCWGVVALIPFFDYSTPMSGQQTLPVAVAYQFSDHLPWKRVLLIHCGIATLAGIAACAAERFRAANSNAKSPGFQLSVSRLFGVLTVYGLIFGIQTMAGVDVTFGIAAAMSYSGYLVTRCFAQAAPVHLCENNRCEHNRCENN